MKSDSKPDINVSIEDIGSLDAVVSLAAVKEVYLDSACIDAGCWKNAARSVHEAGKKCALIMPYVFRTEAESYFERSIEILKESGFDEIIIRSLEEPGFLKENDIELPLVFDANIYVWNRAAEEAYAAMGVSRLTLPVELNSHELAGLDCSDKELIAYGYLPVMVTAQCVRRTVSTCDKREGSLLMKDRTGRNFSVRNVCRFCYNTIYNPVPLTLLGEEEKVLGINPAVLRLCFTTETPAQTKDIIKTYEEAFLCHIKTALPFKEYTRGHFNRGVN